MGVNWGWGCWSLALGPAPAPSTLRRGLCHEPLVRELPRGAHKRGLLWLGRAGRGLPVEAGAGRGDRALRASPAGASAARGRVSTFSSAHSSLLRLLRLYSERHSLLRKPANPSWRGLTEALAAPQRRGRSPLRTSRDGFREEFKNANSQSALAAGSEGVGPRTTSTRVHRKHTPLLPSAPQGPALT